MPNRLTQEQLNNVHYISISDYVNRMDAIENFEDKMAFTTRYLLSYGAEQRDVSLEEAIHIAKVKIADASAALRKDMIMVPDEAVNPTLDAVQDAANRRFMIDPIGYLKDQAADMLHQEEEKGITDANSQKVADLQLMYAVLSNDFDHSMSNKVSALDVEPTSRDVKARLNAKFGGRLENAYEATKPGVLAKMFNKYSTAYHNLDETYKAFNNPDHALYGDMNSLDKAAKEYLQHVFPSWNPNDGLMNPSLISRHLKGTQASRALFSYNILKATAEQRECEKAYDRIISSNLQARALEEANAGDEVLNQSNENAAFQQGLQEDVNDLDQAQIEEDYHNNFADVPEEEVENDVPAVE